MTRNSELLLRDIQKACRLICEFTKGMEFHTFTEDEKTSSAVIRQLEIIGEAAKQLPEEVKRKASQIPWKAMAGMRDRLIHGYAGIDLTLVWDTIQKDIPFLAEQVRRTLES
jgi:uncharacterized protein with HEPN domain